MESVKRQYVSSSIYKSHCLKSPLWLCVYVWVGMRLDRDGLRDVENFHMHPNLFFGPRSLREPRRLGRVKTAGKNLDSTAGKNSRSHQDYLG